MRISDLLDVKSIDLNAAPQDKSETVKAAVQLMAKSGNLNDVEAYEKAVFLREEESTTGVGDGVAIPHGKCDAVTKPGLAAMVIKNGVDYDALDGEPVDLLFLIAAPNTEDNVHLDVLSKLSVLLMDDEFTAKLKAAESPEAFLKVIDDAESEKDETEEKTVSDGIEVLAVTACPTGIAHTYMAAEALEKAAAKLGVTIKVETRGSGGAKNVVTAEEIKNAKVIILATDTKVPMDRFNGKPVIQCKVADGIHKAEQLISDGLAGKASIYQGDSNSESSEAGSGEKGSFAHTVYKHLMNGVSHMLPFVVGGGVLIALGFLIDTIAGNANVGGTFGFTNPIAAVVFWIGKAAFGFMLPILAGYIAESIADRPGLLPGIVGGAFAASGYTFNSLIQNQNLVGDDKAVSGFLGALLAGAIAGLLVNLFKKIFKFLPKAMDGIKPVFIYPLLGTLCIGVIMCAINPVIGILNTALSNGLTALGGSSRLLLCVVLAGMMAVDMGGPFNKVAYVFGTVAISNGNPWIMAAVMVGGMVPPIAIALSTNISKKKWTKSERAAGPVNYLMGLCFITEGAIPYASSDPLRVIPACVVGSAVAGALTCLFKVSCPAPHGGIFTFLVCEHPLLYVLALLAGSVVGALLLGVLKKNVEEQA